MDLKGQKVRNMICFFIITVRGPENMSNCINLICIQLNFDWIVPAGNWWKKRGKKASSFSRGNHPCIFMKLFCEITGWGIELYLLIYFNASFSETKRIPRLNQMQELFIIFYSGWWQSFKKYAYKFMKIH